MFDRCRAWRRMLTRRAEGALTPSERALLDKHLSCCESCRKAQAADEVLSDIFAAPLPLGPADNPSAFDDRVLMRLAAPELQPENRVLQWLRAVRPSISLDFCMQVAGGAFTAAAITAFCVVSALHPTAAIRASGSTDLASIKALQGNEPPVPMESLIQSSSPRAAMLWVQPGAVRHPLSPPKSIFAPGGARYVVPPRPALKRRNVSPRIHSEQPQAFSII